jgi:hypothetical protein
VAQLVLLPTAGKFTLFVESGHLLLLRYPQDQPGALAVHPMQLFDQVP